MHICMYECIYECSRTPVVSLRIYSVMCIGKLVYDETNVYVQNVYVKVFNYISVYVHIYTLYKNSSVY